MPLVCPNDSDLSVRNEPLSFFIFIKFDVKISWTLAITYSDESLIQIIHPILKGIWALINKTQTVELYVLFIDNSTVQMYTVFCQQF